MLEDVVLDYKLRPKSQEFFNDLFFSGSVI